MEEALANVCAEWCRSHYWQLQEKRGWRYAFHESVMVRYYEEANLDTSLLEALVEFLKGEGWQKSFTVHNKSVDVTGWKTRDVWYETRDGDVKEATKLKRTRIYHAVYKEGSGEGDGPYVVEDGCAWKVSHTFHWRVESLPTVPQGTSGVQWRMQGVQRDDETGLWSCVVERRERVQQDVPEYVKEKTVFENRSEEQHLGVKQGSVSGTGKAASVGGGVMVKRQLRKNEDCTTDVVNETVEERPVAGAVEEVVQTARGTRTTTVNRNQAQKAGLGTARSVRNERTEGGLWNQAITQFARILGCFRRTCRKTHFMHEHAETVVVATDPGFTHEVEAGGGIVHERSVQRNDECGFDVETRTREEQPVTGAVVETRKFIDGVQVTTVNRAQAAEASAAGLDIGESVRNERTEGGLVDQTIVKASVEPIGRTGEACEQNALVHAHSRTEGMGSAAQSAELQQVNGQVKTRRVRRTERGAWEVTDETRTAKQGEAEAQGGAQGRRLEVRSLRNQEEIAPPEPGVNEEVEVTVQRNEFGLVDGTVRKVTHQPQSVKATGGSAATTVEVEAFRNETEPKDPGPGGVNEVNDVSQAPNDHGSYDGTLRKVRYQQVEARASGGNMLADVETTVKENAEEQNPAETPQRGTVWDVSAQPNEHGSNRVVRTKRTAKPAIEQKTWRDTQRTASRTVVYDNKIVVFRNQEEVPDFSGWETCSPSISINEFGLLDGVLHLRKLVSDEATGSGSEAEGGMEYHKTRTVRKYYQKRDGKTYYRDYTATYNSYWGGGAAWLARQLTQAGPHDYPEMGLVSGMKGSIMVVYTGIQPGNEHGPLSESGSGSGNSGGSGGAS